MLVISRGPSDKVLFPNLGISLEVLRIASNRVRLGISAPPEISVLRHELAEGNQAGKYSPAPPPAESTGGESPSHRLRNQLNAAHLALRIAQKQLDAGRNDEALTTLQQAIQSFDRLDAETQPSAAPAVQPTPTRRALLVEDDANERELLAGYLRLHGYEVDTAADGLQAIIYLSRHARPDVVLMDMHMPQFDGAQAVSKIRQNPDFSGIRLFAVTGSRPEECRVELGPRGVDRWFRKPIDPQQLVDEMQRELADGEIPASAV